MESRHRLPEIAAWRNPEEWSLLVGHVGRSIVSAFPSHRGTIAVVWIDSNATSAARCREALIVETDDLDVMREPRLIDADAAHRGRTVEDVVRGIQEQGQAVLLACGTTCPFLAADNRCAIYPTRPNACVAMQAGDEQCQEARAAVGLRPLLPIG